MAYSVLLVEDDEQIREVITDYFAAKDGVISVETAADGDKGWSLYIAMSMTLSCLM